MQTHLPDIDLRPARQILPAGISILLAQQPVDIGVCVLAAGEAVQADRLLRGRDDRREREQDAAVPARSDRPWRLAAIGEDGEPGSGGREHACEEGALEIEGVFWTCSARRWGRNASVEKRHH